MNMLLSVIWLPILAAGLCLLFRRAAQWVALLVAILVFVQAILIFMAAGLSSPLLALRTTPLSSGIFIGIAFFTLLVIVYSATYIEEFLANLKSANRLGSYYALLLLTLGSAAAVVFASDYITLMIFWGIIAITLYLLIGLGGPKASGGAKRTLLIVGGADALMLLGVSLIWIITRSLQIGLVPLPLTSPLTIIAFLCLLVGAFAKTGVMPLHSWIPAAAEKAPVSVMAFLPASLDKLLGINLLSLLCFEIFALEANSAVSILLLSVGSITIMGAVLGALVQHDLKKLLSFHAVSQVGYMVVGIGTGSPIGIAGALFHMFNNAIYKSALFLCAGSIEKKTGTTDLEKLGGLAKFMPFTFVAFLVAALAISGLPPFNGFWSKWLIYQAIIGLGGSNQYWLIWLIAAMFGSAFTLASFVKLIHAVFLGQWATNTSQIKEAPWQMWLPTALLAALCLLFGLFPWPLKAFIIPMLEGFKTIGVWQPGFAALMVLIGFSAGLLIYLFTRVKDLNAKPVFTGGELLPEESTKVTGVDFYEAISEWGPLKLLYKLAAKHYFDFYLFVGRLVLIISGGLSVLQNGLLHTYLAWYLVGAILVVSLLMR